MSIGKRQEFFASIFPRLIDRMVSDGLGVRIGDLWAHDVNPAIEFMEAIRQYVPEHLINQFNKILFDLKVMRHTEDSDHYLQIAGDVNLIEDGKLLHRSESHRPYGEYWEALGGYWGGRFKDRQGRPRPDGNHYGVKR